MTFSELVNEVLGIVKRADKIADIRREVNAAVNHFSTDYMFPRDRAELLVSIDANQLTQTLPLSSLARFSKIWYLKPAGTRIKLHPLTPAELFDTTCDRRNKYYIVGENINFSLAAAATALDVGYYQYPPWMTNSSGHHWFLDACPEMIYDRAAAKIFTNIGDDASAGRHEAFAIAAYMSLRRKHPLED